ncbi:NgoFVII family restriction endonuclease [Brevibacillus choshinensis]|uniref:hypothetical protein n=1 Tax=Brevibacillus choshinensis TaxID=54911 RepID=UPI002E21684E|nr:NgoFVII family restriction endonuclease [Brevibacillus choshinensis]
MTSELNLYAGVIAGHYKSGMRRLYVFTQAASSSFVHHLLHQFPSLNLDLVIHTTHYNQISLWDHFQYEELVNKTGRVNVSYYRGKVPDQVTLLIWQDPYPFGTIAYTSDASFSWKGLNECTALAREMNMESLTEPVPVWERLDSTSPNVLNELSMQFQMEVKREQIDVISLRQCALKHPFVVLPLVMVKRNRQVHEKSGLNWGQRPRREPNQAYIPIPSHIHINSPGFFPPRKQEFVMVTDDGASFICVVAQDNDKALETSHDNSILGKYFRNRLGVPLGGKVEATHLSRYGRDDVYIYRLDEDTYYMDFKYQT